VLKHPVVVFAGAIFMATSGCGGSAIDGATFVGQRDSRAIPRGVVMVPIPRLRVDGYNTSGMFPQVYANSVNLVRVNHALRAAITGDEDRYRSIASAWRERLRGPNGPRPLTAGVYRLTLDRQLLSASSITVSVLLHSKRGIDQNDITNSWLGITVDAATGSRVGITQLFRGSVGLRAFGAAWRAVVLRRNPCPRGYPSMYASTPHNFRDFALVRGGIAAGVTEVGACGEIAATVPFSVVRKYLSALGLRLVAGVRRPTAIRVA